MIAFAVLIAACGDGSVADGDGTPGVPTAGASGAPDPCTLADDLTLASYFGEEAVRGESGEAGPIDTCTWRNADANSLLIQVATDFELHRFDPCTGCVDLTFGDDGFATESALQSTATFVTGSSWYSVTTTGFGDDLESIAALAEAIFHNAGN